MIYALLFYEFFKIGLFAIGGGLVTVPFLFDLAEEYGWFTSGELADMIAVSQSTPGPVGINMATYAGYKTAGICGALAATLSEVLPSMIVIYFIAQALNKWQNNPNINKILSGLRPAVLALILFAGWSIAQETITDYKSLGIMLGLLVAMRLIKKSPIYFIAASAIVGVILHI
ncbi:MAG: chromate transporter [Alphaproteobacteria bacterium]|nr:chromate transporter [Alphaproteobacteria bacterium]